MLSRQESESCGGHLVAESFCILLQCLTRLAALGDEVECDERSGDNRRGNRVREEIGTRTLAEEVDDLLVRADVAA